VTPDGTVQPFTWVAAHRLPVAEVRAAAQRSSTGPRPPASRKLV
jgi:hypothetical protein